MSVQGRSQEQASEAEIISTSRPVVRAGRLDVGRRLAIGVGVLSVVLIVVATASLTVGAVTVPVDHVASVVLGWTGLVQPVHTPTEASVIIQIRLPRILVGILVGMALGVAGATMQALFRNPLADPGIIGVSSGGAFGAVICLALGLNQAFPLALPALAFIGAMATAFLVYGLAIASGRVSMPTLLLAGVAVGAFLSALISATLFLVPRDEVLRDILFWLTGGLDSRSWEHVQLAAPLILGGVACVVLFSRDLNLFMLGDDDARAMGVRVEAMRPMFVAAAALITGTAVAVSGVIAFVGLVAPHVVRLISGPDNRVLVPMAALGGAIFLVLADTLTRSLAQPAEMRVGIVTALLGAPFFIAILLRQRRQAESF